MLLSVYVLAQIARTAELTLGLFSGKRGWRISYKREHWVPVQLSRPSDVLTKSMVIANEVGSTVNTPRRRRY